jgi:AcrR family transcriptional regulator
VSRGLVLDFAALTGDAGRDGRFDLDEPTRLDEDGCVAWLWRSLYTGGGDLADCPACACPRRFHRIRSRRSYSCDRCGHHIHPVAATIFRGSSTPLPTLFAALARVAGTDEPIATGALAGELEIARSTAGRLLRRLEPLRGGARRGAPASPARRPALGAPSPSRRAHLLEAACRCIATRGLESARVADIAAAAGVSPAVVHYYFSSKEEILLRALEYASSKAELRREHALRAGGSHADKLARLLALAVPSDELLRTEVVLWTEYFSRLMTGAAAVEDVALAQRFRSFFVEVLSDGQAAGEFSPRRDLSSIVEELMGLIDGLQLAVVLERPWMSPARMFGLLCGFVERELAVERFSAHELDEVRDVLVVPGGQR